ncbi:hypothetical protein BU24DRAFT_166297 [Aaosphaeria arxii CBS 175.79]|uniref:Uncharacterized protein n=1 Tax=Aaosphaeria arxii CBS 175.79 TaxID=1450172 RepID=A0A6A5XZC9_9PLEO|nr:uncharacterized protein BU24DRAFT_166297 [Aaosphaeria arxii CBS 175.79]KAF2018167.1 hypothetical protein BU24DRAFT_166297 [Aaosphaeria arxii CBS 175.79]
MMMVWMMLMEPSTPYSVPTLLFPSCRWAAVLFQLTAGRQNSTFSACLHARWKNDCPRNLLQSSVHLFADNENCTEYCVLYFTTPARSSIPLFHLIYDQSHQW